MDWFLYDIGVRPERVKQKHFHKKEVKFTYKVCTSVKAS